MTEIISPVAIGLISDPPTIVISYDCMSKGGEKWKRRKRKMPLRDFTDRSNVKRYAFNLRQRHSKYLANVIDVTLEKMLRMIQEIQRGKSVEAALEVVNKEFSIDEHEDLNKLSPAQLAQRKAVMDEMFHKNLVKPGDPDFVYDREVIFDDKIEKSDGNDWDEDSDKFKTKDNHHDSNDNENEEKVATSGGLPVLTRKINDEDGALTTILFKSLQSQVITNDEEYNLVERLGEVGDEKETHQEGTLLSKRLDNTSNELQLVKQSSLLLDNALQSRDTTAHPKSDENSSSNNDIEEALVNIESGVLEEEDEDFWQ